MDMKRRRARRGEATTWFEWALSLETDDCIEWPFARMSLPSLPYGVTTVDGTKATSQIGVHRKALILVQGDPPPDKPFACHTCDNPPCMNARHLYWGDAFDNMGDKVAAGRQYRGGMGTRLYGEDHPRSVVTNDQRRCIKATYIAGGVTQQALARQYGISGPLVSQIVNDPRW